MKISLFIAVVMLTFAAQISAQKTSRIAFYNVENLFDTIDNPNDDAEFFSDYAPACAGTVRVAGF